VPKPYPFPDPIGPRRLRFRNDDLEHIEDALESELDKLNARIRAGEGPTDSDTGEQITEPFTSVFDGLEQILYRRMFAGLRVLVSAGIAYSFDGDPASQRDAADVALADMPPSLWGDNNLSVAINDALGVAFGITKPAADTPLPQTPAGPDAG
jgi:hypothetical protein